MFIKQSSRLPRFSRLFFIVTGFVLWVSFSAANPLIYKAGTPVQNKKLVFVASDHEYRAEETLPALARILSVHHGFDCTVLFGQNTKGEIEAGASNIPGLEALRKADGLIMFTRFLALPPAQMKHLDEYFGRAGPVVGLRTSTHAFKYDKNKVAMTPMPNMTFVLQAPNYKGGFGEQILGQSWVGHYGQNHRQSTRIDLVPEKRNHPILRGVSKVHVKAGWLQRRSSTRLEYSNHGSTSYVDGAEWKKRSTEATHGKRVDPYLLPPRTEKRAGCLHPCTERQWIWLIRATGD